MLDSLKSNLLNVFKKSQNSNYNQECVYREKLHKTLSKNNVLLIGNGFDLALGKLSSYQDFLLYLFLIKLYLQVNGDNFQVSSLDCDVLFERSKNLDHKIKCVVEIVKRKIESIKHDHKALSSLCNFFNEKGSFLELFSRVLFQEYYLKFNNYINSIKDHLLDKELVWSFSDFLFYKYNIHRLTDITLFTDLYNTNLEKCVEEFFMILFPKNKENSSIYINGWLDVEKFIRFIVLAEENLKKEFLKDKNAIFFLWKLIKSLNILSNEKTAKKIYESLQLFTDQFCEFLSLQEVHPQESYKGRLAEVFSNYEIVISNDHINFVQFAGYIDEIKNSITSVIDFNYSSTSKSIFLGGAEYQNFNISRPDIYHVNGCYTLDEYRKYQKNNAIFGYSNTTKKQVNINASSKFEKKCQRQLKNVSPLDFDRLTHNRFNLLIFGHSCSLADKDVILPLLLSPNLNLVIIFCYSQEDKLSIYTKLEEILGSEKSAHLTWKTNDLENKLILAVWKKN